LVEAVVNFETEIHSCFVNLTLDEFALFTDSLFQCLQQEFDEKVDAMIRQTLRG
jgi:hypothetical protein